MWNTWNTWNNLTVSDQNALRSLPECYGFGELDFCLFWLRKVEGHWEMALRY